MNSELIIYQNPDGNIKIDVRLEEETVWLTQDRMAALFGKAKSTINEHIKNIYEEQELKESATMKKFGISEFQRKAFNYYNLDVIISVGYRIKSTQGTQFRIWATQRLKEYIIKGFVLNDDRFKSGTTMNYFDELQERIREIRLSEKFFYQKIKDIYSTSIDYDPKDEKTIAFFKVVQNKLLWAISQQTAAELVFQRADENDRLKLEWNLQRTLAKVNYHIHTDAIKENLIPKELSKTQVSFLYTNEADLLNVALFVMTAKQWREANPKTAGNIRDEATLEQLVVLSNLESINSVLTK